MIYLKRKLHILFVISLLACAVTAAGFAPSEVKLAYPIKQVGHIGDIEIAASRPWFTWINAEGEVWFGKFRSTSGEIIPNQFTLIDTNAVPPMVLRNGSEWAEGENIPRIVYTKYDPQGQYFLAQATLNTASWEVSGLPNSQDMRGPIGSLDFPNPDPVISYNGPSSDDPAKLVTYWRSLNNPSTQEMVPGSTTPPGRWAEGSRDLLLSMPENPANPIYRQAFVYNIDNKKMTQVTFGGESKSAFFMWNAPEFDYQPTCFVLTGERYLEIYYLEKETQQWTYSHTVNPPTSNIWIWSPEPIVYKGRTFISMVASPSSNQKSLNIPTEIWLAGINPERPLYRKLSDDTIAVRKDPEPFLTDEKLYIITRRLASDEDPTVETGLFRLDTGF